MLTVGDRFPAWRLMGVEGPSADALELREYGSREFADGWLLVFFWPKDFTFVCPTEIAAFGRLHEEFADRDTRVLGVSGDSEYVHHAWRKDHPDLGDLPFPMLADSRHDLMRALGVEDPDGFARRAVFLVDPHGVIRFSMVTDGSVGRNPVEVLRVLDALRTDALCPCDWTPGDPTLDAAALLSGG